MNTMFTKLFYLDTVHKETMLHVKGHSCVCPVTVKGPGARLQTSSSDLMSTALHI